MVLFQVFENSFYRDIIIRDSKLKDGADFSLNMAGMVTGRTDYLINITH